MTSRLRRVLHRGPVALSAALLAPLSWAADPFVIAVVPDTQNMVSYRHQTSEGFALDGGQQFLHMMQTIADWRDTRGAPPAFVVGVGDVWQHQSELMDRDHRERGFRAIANPYFGTEDDVTRRVITQEMPLAEKGYALLQTAGIPFGVAPGNHDYDAAWSAATLANVACITDAALRSRERDGVRVARPTSARHQSYRVREGAYASTKAHAPGPWGPRYGGTTAPGP